MLKAEFTGQIPRSCIDSNKEEVTMFFQYTRLYSSGSFSQIHKYYEQLQINGIRSKLKTKWMRHIHPLDKSAFGGIEAALPTTTYSIFVKKEDEEFARKLLQELENT